MKIGRSVGLPPFKNTNRVGAKYKRRANRIARRMGFVDAMQPRRVHRADGGEDRQEGGAVTPKKATGLVRESEIEAYLVKRVCQAGGITYKFVSPGRAGVPDRIVIYDGKVAFIELKAPGGSLTALQQQELTRIAEQDVQACWVRSKEGVDMALRNLGI